MRYLLILFSFAISTISLAETLEFWNSGNTVSYSATRLITTDGETTSMKEYHAPGKLRMEMLNPETGKVEMIMLNDFAKNRVIGMMPEEKLAMNMTSMYQFMQVSFDNTEILEKKKIGSEKVNGINTTKYQLSGEDDLGRSQEMLVWYNKDNVLLKAESTKGDDFVMQLKDVKFANQPNELFIVPNDYESAGNASAAMFSQMGIKWGPGSNVKAREDEQYKQDVKDSAAEAAKAGAQDAVEEATAEAVKDAVKDKIKGFLKW